MWKKLTYRIRDYFGFTHGETRAFIVLMLLMGLLLWLPAIFRALLPLVADTRREDQQKLDSLVAVLEVRQPARKEYSPKFPEPSPAATPERFAFDPNQVDGETLQRLGMRRDLAMRLVNYRAKGGKFRTRKDLMRIYGFPGDLYRQLEPYILLPDTLPRENRFAKEGGDKPEAGTWEKKTFARNDFRPQSFDLNTVDTVQLEKLKGIGPALARRVVRYRERLGGFADLQQLHEVYGLDSLVIGEIRKYASITTVAALKKINVNTATAEELRKHPYIHPRLASVIVAYRQQHGPFADARSLAGIKILEPATLQKLEPYLSF